MSNIRIITDSASDISIEDEKQYNIKMLKFKVAIGNDSYVSRDDFDNEKFYTMLEEYDGIPTTSQITPFEFEELYEDQYEKGYTDIMLILINSKGSATYDNAIFAKQNFFEEHPELENKFNIYIFDSRSYSGGYGNVVVEAAKLVTEKAEAENVAKYIEDKLAKSKIYFGIYSLKYAGRSGRIPGAAALVGDVVGIKPIMTIWDHAITTTMKCRGEKKVMANIVKMTQENMEPGSQYCVVYGNDASLKDEITEKLIAAIGYAPQREFQIGAEVAANAGPKVVGTIFESKL